MSISHWLSVKKKNQQRTWKVERCLGLCQAYQLVVLNREVKMRFTEVGIKGEDGVGFLDGPGASPGGIKEIQSKPANLQQGEVGSEQAV